MDLDKRRRMLSKKNVTNVASLDRQWKKLDTVDEKELFKMLKPLDREESIKKFEHKDDLMLKIAEIDLKESIQAEIKAS